MKRNKSVSKLRRKFSVLMANISAIIIRTYYYLSVTKYFSIVFSLATGFYKGNLKIFYLTPVIFWVLFISYRFLTAILEGN